LSPSLAGQRTAAFEGSTCVDNKKASGEFSLVCAVHNFKKIVSEIISAAGIAVRKRQKERYDGILL
jgi:hypothetical protein